jgi:hypothetical protein
MHKHLASFKSWYVRHKKATVPLTILLVVGIGAGVWFGFLRDRGSVSRVSNETTAEENIQAQPILSPLTGLEVSASLAKRPVLGVMIENSPSARPQSGLDRAGVVFEAIAEGGITRFLALYQEDTLAQIGPVRSVREYYVDWTNGFNASLTHVGGSATGLVRAQRVLGAKRNFDEFRYGARLVPRVSFRPRPHNAYTSTQRMLAIAKETGHTSSKFTSLARKEPAPAEKPTARSITANFSSPLFRVGWTYDKANNSYLRSNGGVRQSDRASKKPLRADVVIVMKARYRTVSGAGHQRISTLGKGQVFIFQDGIVTKGTWRKPNSTSQFTFTDAKGEEIKLNPGRTWFEVIPTDQSVTYK